MSEKNFEPGGWTYLPASGPAFWSRHPLASRTLSIPITNPKVADPIPWTSTTSLQKLPNTISPGPKTPTRFAKNDVCTGNPSVKSMNGMDMPRICATNGSALCAIEWILDMRQSSVRDAKKGITMMKNRSLPGTRRFRSSRGVMIHFSLLSYTSFALTHPCTIFYLHFVTLFVILLCLLVVYLSLTHMLTNPSHAWHIMY